MKIYGICVNILDSTTFALYVLMELALGDWNDEIKKHLNVRKNYKEEDLINILKQLVNSLLFMQENMKIAHRDIKPQNILVFKNKLYKVADFGEAKEAKIAKQLNTLRGTELYSRVRSKKKSGFFGFFLGFLGFFWVFWVFLGFLGFFWVFWVFWVFLGFLGFFGFFRIT